MATAVSAAVSLSSSSKSTTSLPTRSSIISPERISFFKVPVYCRNVYTSGRVIEKVSKKDDEGVLVNKCKPKEPFIGRWLLNPGETWHMVFSSEADESLACETLDRRKAIVFAIAQLAICGAASASEFADMPALKGKDYGKTKMRYPDYVETKSGLQYKDLRVGNGPTPRTGETVVVDWDGYTIGYYGRIFEARNKTKGGSFEGGDKDFFKFKIGSQEVIPAFEEAVSGMAVGGIRRIIVPPELGYPEYDYNKQGPRPTTFSGQRALDFVLRNQGLIDKTLLFDIELLKINPN